MPLGILPKNENKGEDTVALMDHLHQYAPLVKRTECQYVASIARARPIPFGGDQLTVARARGHRKPK